MLKINNRAHNPMKIPNLPTRNMPVSSLMFIVFLMTNACLYTNSSKTRYITPKKNINIIEITEIVVFVGVIYIDLRIHLFGIY